MDSPNNPNPKDDLKKISILMPNDLSSLKDDIEIIIEKNEDIIEKHIERIYTCPLSPEIKAQLYNIFKKTKASVLDKC
jgi:hypothetical protein